MSTDGTYTQCQGDNCLGNAGDITPTLQYGQSVSIGPFTCLSTMEGVQCTVSSGTGFLIAKSGVTKVG